MVLIGETVWKEREGGRRDERGLRKGCISGGQGSVFSGIFRDSLTVDFVDM